MSSPSMLFEAYSPQLPPGDWQIVLSVKLTKGRIAVERWHSSDPRSGRSHCLDKKLYIETGIRAFRRQIPVLEAALETINVTGLSMEEAVATIFGALSDIYGTSRGAVQFLNGSQGDTGTEVTDFLRQQERKALADLAQCTHSPCARGDMARQESRSDSVHRVKGYGLD